MKPATSIVKESIKALLTLISVGIVLFVLFHAFPGESSALEGGQAGSEETSALTRFPYFVNDLSPLSYTSDLGSKTDWSAWFSIPLAGKSAIVFKWPYLGRSIAHNTKVSGVILEALPESIVLVLATLLLAALIGIPLGVYASRYPNRWLDTGVRTFASAGLAIPSFVAAILIAWVFGYLLYDLFGLSVTGSLFEYDFYAGKEVIVLPNLILPAFALSIRPMCVTTQLMRNTMMEVLRQDYIRTARAKGLPERVILFRHALVNAINPVLTELGAWAASLLAGSIFVEYVFGWKGLGNVLLKAIEFNDIPVMIGLTLVISATFIIVNWVLKLITPLFDPSLIDQ